MFSHSLRYVFIVVLAIYSYLNALSVEVFDYYPIPVPLATSGLLLLLATLGIWESNRFINNWLHLERLDFNRRIPMQFGISIVVTMLLTLLLALLTIRVYGLTWSRFNLSVRLFLLFAFRINLFLNTVHVIFEYIKQLRNSQMEAEQLKKVSVQAELQAIRSQVNPHFLFNNLSVLAALIPKDVSASVAFVEQFAKVYRYVLVSHEKELTTLDDELAFIESYLFLLDKRFGAALQVDIDVSQRARKRKLVPVALQMLIENAVKHNVVAERRPLYIVIKDLNDNTLLVQNNLQRRTDDHHLSTGVGLSNIVQRYGFLSNQVPEIQETTTNFMVKIPLLSL